MVVSIIITSVLSSWEKITFISGIPNQISLGTQRPSCQVFSFRVKQLTSGSSPQEAIVITTTNYTNDL